jgi:hypothetical protein
MTIYEALQAAGATLDSHESDLYVFDTPAVRKLFQDFAVSATPFRHDVTNELWWDIAFAFDPWWEAKGK